MEFLLLRRRRLSWRKPSQAARSEEKRLFSQIKASLSSYHSKTVHPQKNYLSHKKEKEKKMKMSHHNRGTDLLHVNPISVGPHVVGVVLDSMPQGTGNLVKPDEFSNLLHLRVITRRSRVQPRYDGSYITKYSSVKKC